HAEPYGEHKFRRIIGNLYRAQFREAQPRLLCKVHTRDKKLHILHDVAGKHAGSTGGNAVVVLFEPGLEAIAFQRRQNQDVVFSNRLLRLDFHTETHFLRRSATASSSSASTGTTCGRRSPRSYRTRIRVE